MPDEPTPYTDETRAAAYKTALEEELRGAQARASAPGLSADAKAVADASLKDVQAELARVSGSKSKPATDA